MFNKRTTNVAVLGAGPVGLAASHGLLAHGVDHCLFEQAGGVHSHSYALALHPETMERMHGLGLSERILAHALKIESIAIFDGPERKLTLDCSKLPSNYPYLTVIGQNHLEEILATGLEQQRHPVMWHHRGRFSANFAESMRLEVDRLYTGLTGYAVAHLATQVDKTYTYDVNYVLGSDGLESSVRRLMGAGYPDQGRAKEYAVFEFRADGDIPQEMRLILKDGKTHVYWPLPNGYCRWSFQLPAGNLFPGQREQSHPMIQSGLRSFPLLDRDHLNSMLAETAPWFKAHPGPVRWRTIVRFQNRLADSYGRDRLWVVGDAAHSGPPAGMLSMNYGIGEALDWVECLVREHEDRNRIDSMTESALKWRARWHESFDLESLVLSKVGLDSWLYAHMHQLAGNIPLAPREVATLMDDCE